MIVKTKKEGNKGEVIKVIDKRRIIIKQEGREREYREEDLSKVIPETGLVHIFSLNKVACVTKIDLQNKIVTAKSEDLDGNKEVYKVKLDDICKVKVK